MRPIRIPILLLFVACNNDGGLKVYNSDPEVSFTQPASGSTFASGAAIQLVATLHDDQTDVADLQLVWTLEDGSTLVGVEVRSETGVSMVLEDGLEAGEHTITLTAVDGAAASGKDSVDLSVVKNQPPVAEFLNPLENQLVALEDPLRVELQVTDSDEDDLAAVSLVWGGVATGDADAPAFTDSSGKAVFYLDNLPAGNQQLSVQVSDSLGAVGNAIVAFEVRAGDTDGDGHTGEEFGGDDCNDDDATVYTGATEVCNGRDEDCDGLSDEEGADAPIWFPDVDQDGYGDGDGGLRNCTQPPGYLADGSDCDDADVAVNPSVAEECDGIDNNCDGLVDEAGAIGESLWYEDADGDSFGNAGVVASSCGAPANYVADTTDCDDRAVTVYPGAPEHCDSVDEDCDGTADNAAIDAGSWYTDRDGDSFGDATQVQTGCSAPAGTVADATDCNDAAATIFPAAPEHCDGVDEDCDGTADNNPVDAGTWYLDSDSDGYGVPSSSTSACSLPTGYAATDDDCNDANAAIHPGAAESSCTDPTDYNCDGSSGYADRDADGFAACEECDDSNAAISPSGTETCNGADDDCNGSIDDAATDATPWYVDADADGFGNSGSSLWACTAPSGYVADATDCNDADGLIWPGAPEYCDGVDNNCDGSIDEDAAVDVHTWYADADADGYGQAATTDLDCAQPAGFVANATDCDDGDSSVYPGAAEYCDGEDDDCDGQIDEDDALDVSSWYADADADGYGSLSAVEIDCEAPAGFVANADDCDDAAAAVYPGADEYCNGDDDDCNGTVDDDAVDALTWYADSDADGYGSSLAILRSCSALAGFVATGDDCNDADPGVHPGASEYCDGQDDDCDGSTDEADAVDVHTWYADADSDGYGAAATSQRACNQPSNYVSGSSDCDDTDSGVNPAALEYCDGEDDDCDGQIDEATAVDVRTWYADADRDGYGDASASSAACSAPSGYVATATDCDDTAAQVYPGATEYCNGDDDDCDGNIDDNATDALIWYVDADADGFGSSAASTLSCAQPTGYAAPSTDCNDSLSTVYPGATEACNGRDDDCDGSTDEAGSTGETTWYRDADADGYGSSSLSQRACTAPSGYVASATDCNDAVATISPAATEICDGNLDNDCDGLSDDADPSVSGRPTWYADADADGYGASTNGTQVACTAPSGYLSSSTDCNDGNAAISPGDPEICDAANTDEDCDGAADDNDASVDAATKTAWYVDGDADGYAGSTTALRCDANSTHLATSTDCNDNNANISPGDPEVCDSANTDEDCDGTGDEQGATGCLNYYVDADGDGYGSSSYACLCDATSSYSAATGDDCDDASAAVNPNATETTDGIDNDCDGIVDEIGQEWLAEGTINMDWIVQRTSGGSTTDALGLYYSDAKDVNGDGINDFMIGNPDGNYNGSGSGAVLLYKGPITRGSVSSSASATGAASTHLDKVALIGDQNNDGMAEMLTGAYAANTRGQAYLTYGATTPSLTTPTYTISGASASTATGTAVAAAGDFFGDGTDDFLVCSTASSYVRWNLFDGPIAASGSITTATVTFTSAYLSDSANAAIDAEGDLNGDGLADLVVGAKNANTTGQVWVDYGLATMSGAQTLGSGSDVVRTTSASSGDLGASVAILPDLNADGYDELLVGDSSAKAAYLEFGPPTAGSQTITSVADITISSTSLSSFGIQLTRAGDMDSDGREDYAIGAYSSAYIFYDTVTAGSYDPATVASVILTSGDTCTPGQQLAYGGDLDSDGVDDLLIPCPIRGSTSQAPRTFVISGALRRMTVEGAGGQTGDTTILGTSGTGNEYGYSVASGDFNDDGFADVIAGDYSAGTFGAAKLHLGPFAATERTSTPDGSYPNTLQSDYFGWTLSGPGEVNGDVYDDFIIGGPLTDTSVGVDAGMVYLIPGAAAGYSANLSTFTYVSGAAAGDQFGYDVALIGDVDGDTYSEFIVGAPYQDNPAVDAGRVYFYYTPLSGSAQAADAILKGEATLDHLGWAVAGGRDLDGDGFDDFIVGAPDNDAVASAAGKAYLFLNPPSGTVNATTADAFFRGAAASDQLGYDLAMAEDINGDGTDDLIIGAPGNDDAGSGYGKAYLWWGEAFSGTYAASSADESIVGTYTNDGIGYRVAGAGDINQDGYGDVLAAGPLSSDFATNAGKVIYVHGPVTNRTPFIWMGATANDEAGRGLAAVDDQDLNGFPEYAIGSQDANANLYGEVYIRQGATSNR